MTTVNLNTSNEETLLVKNIVDRANKQYQELCDGRSLDITSTQMDIAAVHLNDIPLDLKKLLAAPDPDLMHDVLGISRFIDRNTGKLTDCFLPRCAKPQDEVKND